jgi:hypothetical protein
MVNRYIRRWHTTDFFRKDGRICSVHILASARLIDIVKLIAQPTSKPNLHESVYNRKSLNLEPANRKGMQIEIPAFRLRSGPFQHLSPFEKCITLYDSSNLSHRLMTQNLFYGVRM